MNTKDSWTTTVRIMDAERAALWSAVFPGARMPIKNIIPQFVKVRGQEELVYLLDLDALTEGQINDIVATISKRFDLDPVEIRMEMQQGAPILAKNTIAESTSLESISVGMWEDLP